MKNIEKDMNIYFAVGNAKAPIKYIKEIKKSFFLGRELLLLNKNY